MESPHQPWLPKTLDNLLPSSARIGRPVRPETIASRTIQSKYTKLTLRSLPHSSALVPIRFVLRVAHPAHSHPNHSLERAS